MSRDEVEAGLRFAVDVARENAEAADRLAARADALAATLAARRIITEELAAAVASPFSQYDLAPVTGPPAEAWALDELPDVDCVALYPICKARCCRFYFPLSVADVERGVVRWDPRRPYFIRNAPDGRCVHQGERGACGVYHDRPAPCRVYDCRDDPRIWLDFEHELPNPHEDDGPSRMALPLTWVVPRQR